MSAAEKKMTREIKTEDDAKAALHEVASEFGVSLGVLLDPNKVRGFCERSELLRDAMDFFAQQIGNSRFDYEVGP